MSEAEAPALKRPAETSGNRTVSLIGYALGLMGAALLAFDRRLFWDTGDQYVFTESLQIPFLTLGIGIGAVGFSAYLLFKWIPSQRSVTWPPLAQETLAGRWIANETILHVSAALVPVGAGLMAWTYHAQPGGFFSLLVASWIAVGLGGLGLVWAGGRNGLIRRLLAHTLHHEQEDATHDEESELQAEAPATEETPALEAAQEAPASGKDPRLAIVLPALDDLLGKISDEDLESFKGTEASKLYVELLEEAL